MVRIIPIVLIILCVSCKDKKSSTTPVISEETSTTRIDTTYCNGFNRTIEPKEISTSMYNEPYSISITLNPLEQLRVLSSEGNNVTVCNEHEGTIILKKSVDTIFTKKINKSLFSDEATFSELQKLRLDSISHNGVRTHTLYFNCYFSEYNSSTVLESVIGIDYKKDIGKTFVFTPLKELEN